ncbi:hypothetical protein E4T43_07018 [Aureobasidium subglaciale]|nr:hypothetical protein E4T43_07018 [Aureobasidium subglaciale]
MADADEDVIPRGPDVGDIDLSDETQDFRFLLNFSSDDAKIPKRGEKDFEPHHTNKQSDSLAASRDAMHTALSFQRVHQPKKYVLAHYHPKTNMAYTEDPKGPLFKTMGRVFPGKEDPLGPRTAGENRIWLLPEEVIYLLERGTIDVRWPVDEDDEGSEGLPMSLQGAYAAFLGMEGTAGGALTFERYSVYSGLKRSGYTVHRAPSWDSPGEEPSANCYPPMQGTSWTVGLLRDKWRNLFIPRSATEIDRKTGPLVTPGLYRNYDPAFRITYHLWKPGSMTYKKSDPGTPDFRIAVINARETSFPTVAQLGALIDTQPYQPPRQDVQLYQKLRSGYKSVILAVVDQGVTSYLRLADAGFSREKLFDLAKYYALCHNCQKWHLPSPCQEEAARCGGCQQLGHLQEYCALAPSPSSLFTTNMSAYISHDLTADNTQCILHNAALADDIYHIKMGAVMDTLRLFAGRNSAEDIRRHLATTYRGPPRPSSSVPRQPASGQHSAPRQLPTPGTANAESITSEAPTLRPNIPQAQSRNTYHNHTLPPILLRDGVRQPQQSQLKADRIIENAASGTSSCSATSREPDVVHGVTHKEPQNAYDGIFSFRNYDAKADGIHEQAGGDSSGNGSFTPRSSPCDARANSTESREETEQEHEIYEGSTY